MPAPSPPPSALPVYHADSLRTTHDVLTDHHDVSVYLTADVDAAMAGMITAEGADNLRAIASQFIESTRLARQEVARLSRALTEEKGKNDIPNGVLHVNDRMREPQLPVHLTEAQRPTADWLKAHGFIEDRYVLAMCWSSREGMAHRDLEFYPVARHPNDAGFLAIIGEHASGENPRLQIGTCETLADVQMVCETIRLINGYKQPEPWHVSDGKSSPGRPS